MNGERDPGAQPAQSHDSSRIVYVTTLVILSAGALLRSVQYFSTTSLWFDELAIALNIRDRTFLQLISEPLDLLQSAPAAFLVLVKVNTEIFGLNEIGLRALPWACSLLALYLFWRVAVRLMDGPALVGTLALFSVSPGLVWYAGNLKQYSGDVAMTLLLVLIALRIAEEPLRRRAIRDGLLGAVAILLSHPGILTAALLGAGLVALEVVRGMRAPALAATARKSLATILFLWAVAAAAATISAFVVTGTETRAYMEVFWHRAFLPPVWNLFAFLWGVASGIPRVFSHFLVHYADTSVPGIFFIVAAPMVASVPGFIWLLRSKPGRAFVLLAPVLAGVGAATAQILPLQDRIVLFMGWPVLVLAGLGIHAAGRWRPGAGWATAILVAGLLPIVVLGGGGPPYRAEEIRPVLRKLSERLEEDDHVYAYYGARHAMSFYGPLEGVNDWVQGGCHRGDPRAYLRELDSFRGSPRVWVVFTHALPGYREPETILSYLDASGVRLVEIQDEHDLRGQRASSAFLYDLSDTPGPTPVRWETFPLPDIDTAGLRDCEGRLPGQKQ